MIKFSIKIDDDEHSLTKENGINFSKIGELLQKLYAAIDYGNGGKATLGQIRGNCYALDFYTEDLGLYESFIVVHQNISQSSIDDLPNEQKQYANILKVILGDKYYLKAYNNDGVEIADINSISEKQLTSYYYSTDTVYGILSELGSATLNSPKKHIYIDGIPYKVYISKTQDLELKPYYGINKLRFELRQKRATSSGKIVSSELKSFVKVSSNNLIDNLNNEEPIELEIIKDAHTIEDILTDIYAIK